MIGCLNSVWIRCVVDADMPKSCWALGCSSGYHSCSDKSRHLFRVPANKVHEWSRKIPHQGQLSCTHYICDVHFEDRFLVKVNEIVVNGDTVRIPSDDPWHLMLYLHCFQTCRSICLHEHTADVL